jgi:polar amino acid transport system permease protein
MMRGSPFSDRNSKASDKTTINVTDGTLIPLKDEGTLLSAWIISVCGAIALLVLLPVLCPDADLRILSVVPDGLVATFSVTLVSIFFALLIGLFAGLGRISQKRSSTGSRQSMSR